jgi:flavin-dependent dehydrogenase
VNERAVRLLDFPITPVVEQVVNRARITYKMKDGFTRSFPQPFTYMTMRDRLDSLLAERAVSAGADLMDGVRVEGIDLSDGGPRISYQGEVVTGRVLVGADGANSVVARSLGLLQGAEMGVALESEVYTQPQHREPWASTAGMDFGTVRGGYMWVFPKEDHLSIGIVRFVKLSNEMRPPLGRFLQSLQLGDYQQRLTRGHRLPRRRRGMPIQKGPALLIGDAAGLIDFWTGEGIYHAVKSAQMAAPTILDYLEGKSGSLQQYEDAIDREMMPELHITRTIMRIAVWFPRLAYTLMKNSDWAWDAGCQILRSERSYHDVRRKMGHFTFLFDLAGRGI